MIKEGGVVGFKCFLIHSGIDEFPAVQEDDVCKAMYVSREEGGEREIEKMIKEGGVVGFKCFLIHSSTDEFPAVSEDDVCKAMYVRRAERREEEGRGGERGERTK